jgi:VIT1/CCC1 family predicted Fe2+/Mn2+ transporter
LKQSKTLPQGATAAAARTADAGTAPQRHRIGRTGWLRAAVPGANDGHLSTARLVPGVAAAHGDSRAVLVAGAMSMAAGEYVPVRFPAGAEAAGLNLERADLRADGTGEPRELAAIYAGRGDAGTVAGALRVTLRGAPAMAVKAAAGAVFGTLP